MQRKILRLQNEFRKQQYANQQAQEQHNELQSLSNALNNNKSQLQLNQKFKAVDQIDDLDYENQTQNQEQLDEYTKAIPPKILITTSRNPSPKLKQFIKELAHIIPTAERINRGQRSVQELMQQVREAGFTDLIIAHENRGTPDALIISHVPFGPTLWLQVSDLVLKQDVNPQGTFATKPPHLIFENLNQKVGKRVVRILQHLFTEPKEDSDRVIAFMNRSDTIVFRNYQYAKVDKEVILKEQGPRFNITPFKIQSDSLDQKGDIEWQLNTFTNTAYKVQVL